MTINRIVIALAILLTLGVGYFARRTEPISASRAFYTEVREYLRSRGKVPKAKARPNDWFYIQRAYPGNDVPVAERKKASDRAKSIRQEAALKANATSLPVWQLAGPSNIPGRIADLAVHPTDLNTVYAGSAAGGVFKSTNGGANWTPMFDDIGPQPVGAIAVHPSNGNIVYAGTGEANAATDNYEGTGIYKSIDGGTSWTFVGLPNSYSIGRILIDPLRPETVYVAVAGRMFGFNTERGVYRSQNGGGSWQQIFSIDDSTGCVDIAMHPTTGTLFAGMWHRWRNPMQRQAGGWTTAIWRSTDFGTNWTKLNGGMFTGVGLPAPSAILGRIGLTVDPSSGVTYAMFDEHPGNFAGIYRSDDFGTSWTRTNDGSMGNFVGGFGWYFGQIRCLPGQPDIVYALGVSMYRSLNGGTSWSSVANNIHSDHHALAFHPANSNTIYEGGDGGISQSTNGGTNWTPKENMPNTQFYAMSIDYLNPQRLYGGTQDNGTLRTLTGTVNTWDHIHGGDGFYTLVDFTNSDVIYAEYQNGVLDKSVNASGSWTDAMNGIDYNNERHNWSTPFAMAPYDNNVLYYGSNVLYRTDDGAANWTAISPDLTDGNDPGNLTFGTITTIGISENTPGVVYVGTDDANVWITEDNGGFWTDISTGLPNRWVTRVTVHPVNPDIAYVALSGYKVGDHAAHIYKTTNAGSSWTPIGASLFDAPVNDLVLDPDYPDSAFYVATDFGVYMTTDDGQSWIPLDQGMPWDTPVHDIDFHEPTRALACGTHGRSMYRTTIACPDTLDTDIDSVMNRCDNCPTVANASQIDTDQDGIGDACETCACDCHGDPANCEGVTTVLDVIETINIAFRGQAAISDPNAACPFQTTDVNCDAVTTILDVVKVINVAFRGANQTSEFCDPCP